MNRFIMRPLGYLCHLILRQMEGYEKTYWEGRWASSERDNRHLRDTNEELRSEVRVGETEKEFLALSLERHRTHAKKDIALFLREGNVGPPPGSHKR